MGPGVGVECIETKDGLTLWEDHFYPEIIDPETGAVLAEGEFGELVLTTLTKEALPAIRYRTRDLTRLLPGTARPMRRLQRITGRSDDMLIVRGVNVFPSQIEELIARDERLTLHYQIHLTRNGALDEVALHVEAQPAVPEEQHAPCAQALAATIKGYAGVTMRVNVTGHGSIPRSQGKAVRVVDQRRK
jgi:phenylacetate-CoA ligase